MQVSLIACQHHMMVDLSARLRSLITVSLNHNELRARQMSCIQATPKELLLGTEAPIMSSIDLFFLSIQANWVEELNGLA